MNAFLNNMSIRNRMALSVLLFMVVFLFAMYNAWHTIEANIAFSAQEEKGNTYQRPLAQLLYDAGRLRVALGGARAGSDTRSDVTALIPAIDGHMAALKEAQAAVGEDLQFTKDGLGSRGRENLAYEAVLQKWQGISDAVKANIIGGHDEAVASFIADIRGMVAHSGDTSNLILDPDLDSYYLMDITLLALPQTLDRLSVIGSMVYPRLLRDVELEAGEKTQMAVMSHSLRESDIDRITAALE